MIQLSLKVTAMSELKPVRVPVPVVIALAVLVLACAETSDYDDSSYYYDDSSSCSGSTYNGCSGSSSSGSSSGSADTGPAASSAPAQPVLPSYIPELDKSRPPEYPKTTDVTIQYGRPEFPSGSSQDLWTSLQSKYGVDVKTGAARGNIGEPWFEPSFTFGDDALLLVSESRTEGSTRWAHGLAILTYNSNRQYETYTDGYILSSSDPYTLGIGYMNHGRMHGPWVINYTGPAKAGQTNKLHYICEYQYGKANGECRWWDENGYLERQDYYKGGVREGTCTVWKGDYTTQSEYVGGVEYGLYRKWNGFGQLIERAQVFDNRKYGKSEFWYPGETYPYIVRFYNFGPNTGWVTRYDASGHLHHQAWIEDSVFTGPFVQYHPTGYKSWEGQRVNNVNEGKFTGYDAQGRVITVCSYQAGMLHGDYIRYDAEGNITAHDVYENDEWVRSELAPTWPAPIEVTDADGNPIKRTFGRWRVEIQDDMPPMEHGMGMAWHGKLGGCVMFGGRGGPGERSVLFAQTWLRKDGKWQRVFAETDGPAARENPAMAYDSARGVVVLFGGRTADGTALDDTWVLTTDGWRQVTSASRPDARAAAGLAYDSARGVCVLVGGAGTTGAITPDFWEWNGRDWSKSGAGPAVQGAAVGYDEQRECVVVQGGAGANGELADTWVFEAGRWRRSSIIIGQAQSMHAMVYDFDSRSMVLLGNSSIGEQPRLQAHRPTDYFFATYWSATRPDANPLERYGFSAAYDRGTREVVVFGGRRVAGEQWPFRETLVLTDETADDRAADTQDFIREKLTAPGWTFIDNGEIAQRDHFGWALAHDSKRGVTVMFGGSGAGGPIAVTREFKDGTWILRTPSDAPEPRSGSACWFDASRGAVMVYGGNGADGVAFDDLWEWDGNNWTRLREHVPGAPPSFFTSAYDEKRGVLVVLHERDEGSFVYEFNGTTWRDTGVMEPSGLEFGSLCYNPIKQQVLYSYPMDLDSFETLSKAWHWDGKYWAEYNAVTQDNEAGLGHRFHSDAAGNALWQVTDEAIRRFDGASWQAWKRPAGLDAWNGRLWVNPEDGRVYFHGTQKTWGKTRNDTLVFDPAQGEKIK
ncbi:MAG: hypothetical protein H6841_01755 [Planctomycetes bacterium]|nr:hypothetical protein [Planctomycetota bacterium]MCB9935560.1 hypothetical protein [Planctomycetota bacterium]